MRTFYSLHQQHNKLIIYEREVDETVTQIKDYGQGSVGVFAGIDPEDGYENWDILYKSYEEARLQAVQNAEQQIAYWQDQLARANAAKQS